LFAFECRKFALDLLAAGDHLGERVVDAFGLDLGFGRDRLPIAGFLLQLDLASDRGARQIQRPLPNA
jgi:hypothetical protein